MEQGESELACRSAPFTKLLGVMLGAATSTEREKVCEPVPELEGMLAVTDAGPVTVPAVAVTWARPFASVVAEVADRLTDPLDWNCTVSPAGVPALVVTWTTNGCAKA